MWKIMASFVLGALLGAGGVYWALKGPLFQKAERPAVTAQDQAAKEARKPDARKPAVPSLSAAQALASRSMQDFAKALKEGKMDRFYATLSDYWKQRTTPAKLEKAFAPMLKAKLDLTGVATLRPIIEKGSGITPRGELLLKGRYNVSNGSVLFSQSYRAEGAKGWRLVSFFVQVVPKKAEGKPAPTK